MKEETSYRKLYEDAQAAGTTRDDRSFIDTSEFTNKAYLNGINICGPRRSGKSTLLSMLRCYFDDLEDSEDVFKTSKHYEKYHDLLEMGRHPVIFLDFSDFAALSMDEAVLYLKRKFSSLYRAFFERLNVSDPYFLYLDYYLDIVEGVSSTKKLEYCLDRLVACLNSLKRTGEASHIGNPMILIDEMGRLRLFASYYGYDEEMRTFLDSLLHIDCYKQACGLITTSFVPADADVEYRLGDLENISVSSIRCLRDLCRRCGVSVSEENEDSDYRRHGFRDKKYISLRQCFEELGKTTDAGEDGKRPDMGIVLDPEMKAFIDDRRKWIEECKRRAEEKWLARKKREREEYAAVIDEDVEIPSEFAGMRELEMERIDPERLDKLRNVLISLYREFGNTASHTRLYERLQNIRKNRIDNGIENVLEGLSENTKRKVQGCFAHVNCGSDWNCFTFKRSENDGSSCCGIDLIKVYLSVCEPDKTMLVFTDLLGFLIDSGARSFISKMSCYERDDAICVGLARDDFFRLEKHARSYEDILAAPMPFVACRGKLGISRQLYDWKSHNAAQALLIKDYFSLISDENEIDLMDMYGLYVKAWNGDLEDDHLFTKDFRLSNAQEFLVLVETLSHILTGDVPSDNILLNDDEKLWMPLATSKNWYEVGRNLKAL